MRRRWATAAKRAIASRLKYDDERYNRDAHASWTYLSTRREEASAVLCDNAVLLEVFGREATRSDRRWMEELKSHLHKPNGYV